MKILFFGDVFGKIGRQAISEILPKWRKQYSPDVVIANADNVTHGNGINESHFKSLSELGIDLFTAGDHTLRREQTRELLNNLDLPILRAANVDSPNGEGVKMLKIGEKKLLVISLLGRTWMDENIPSPFTTLDEILASYEEQQPDAIVVDFHAEATSEKSALPWYVDGRVSAVLGTHTHVQTADERILPNGTAVITDVGFCGAVDSVIGVEKEEIINHFLTGSGFKMNIPEKGLAQLNGILLTIGDDSKAQEILRLNEQINIS